MIFYRIKTTVDYHGEPAVLQREGENTDLAQNTGARIVLPHNPTLWAEQFKVHEHLGEKRSGSIVLLIEDGGGLPSITIAGDNQGGNITSVYDAEKSPGGMFQFSFTKKELGELIAALQLAYVDAE